MIAICLRVINCIKFIKNKAAGNAKQAVVRDLLFRMDINSTIK